MLLTEHFYVQYFPFLSSSWDIDIWAGKCKAEDFTRETRKGFFSDSRVLQSLENGRYAVKLTPVENLRLEFFSCQLLNAVYK